MRIHALALVFPAVAAGLPAQTTIPLDPRATYLRTNNDTPAAPLVLDLAALGAVPGSWLRLATTGAYAHVTGGPDDHYSLCGVFSGSPQLLGATVAHRVPAAIAAGPAFASVPTFSGGLPTDIAEDFLVSRMTWTTGMYVEVPPGATHVFLGTHDSLYRDNNDPNLDFAVVVTLLPAPPLPGTGEHLELRAAAGAGGATALPSDHAAPAGAALLVELHHPIGLIDGSLYAIFGDVAPTGSAPPMLLPRVWIGPSGVVLQLGVIPATAGWFASWGATVPQGLLGWTLYLQGGGLTPQTRNGSYETTIAHRFAFS